MRMRTALLFAAPLLAACGSARQSAESDDDVRLSVSAAAPAPGDSVLLVLTNGSSREVGYNLCTSALERRAGADWVPVPEDRVCTMELRILPPGEEAEYTLTLPPGLEPGEYRYGTSVERLETGEGGRVVSEPFRVTP